MLRFWLNMEGNKATGNTLERALRKAGRDDIVNKCIFNVELVTDELEKSAAKAALHSDMVRQVMRRPPKIWLLFRTVNRIDPLKMGSLAWKGLSSNPFLW